jgi:hypothetical protein
MGIDSTARSNADDRIRKHQLRRNKAAFDLLDMWERYGNEQEQTESLAYIKEAVDADRPGQRKHFS